MASVTDDDAFAKLTGMRVVSISPGRAVARLTLAPEHRNGFGGVHGGVIFTLADLAFGAACNSYDFPAVGLSASIAYLKVPTGSMLTAEAAEVAWQGKTGSYAVQVMDESGEVVASFLGLAFRKWAGGAGRDSG